MLAKGTDKGGWKDDNDDRPEDGAGDVNKL